MVDPNPNGERLARLEERSVNLERAVDRVEKKVDGLETKIDNLEGQIDKALGGFRVFAWVWSVGMAAAAVIVPYLAHLVGIVK